MSNQDFAPILIILGISAAFLYMHFTGASTKAQLWLAALLVVTGLGVLAPSLGLEPPAWWTQTAPVPRIQLGLDLRGGTHLLMQVKLQDAVRNALSRTAEDLKRELASNKVGVKTITLEPAGALLVQLSDSRQGAAFSDLMRGGFPDLEVSRPGSAAPPGSYQLRFTAPAVRQVERNAMDQALETIRNRIDQLGVRETTVAREGTSEILVQLPGIQDPERAKELIGKTAVLEFKLVDDNHSLADALRNGPPPGDEILYGPPGPGGRASYLVEAPVLMTGDAVTDARVRPGGRLEGPYVSVDLDRRGADVFDAVTSQNVGRRLAIVLDHTVYSAPVIKERIPGGRVQITGSFSVDEAHDLAIVLRSGALPAPVTIIEERTVGPSLGRDSIRRGEISFVVGALVVLIFMAVYYDRAGIVADLGLALNILLLLCVMAAMQATLTLPGIAGIVLTLGMSVDANVLVNERMREELRNGKSPREAVRLGYERAWSAIRDSNISTFVAGLILFQFGTGPVKGFAVTLCVGVLTGLFSCLAVTRAWYDHQIANRRLSALSV
ncbi:MAG: protein translocase subunit SecD [Deltaproteobacteria bacterium]|nr:protein translocase subunit SecD [Deltaproteobacteria bacterium]